MIIKAHRPDRLTPIEETVRAFNFVIDQGCAFYWGTSEWSADEISEACGIAKSLGLIGPIVEQPLYNILDRKKVEGEFQRLYSRYGIGLTTFSPIKMGLLSGKYDDSEAKPPEGSRFSESKDNFAKSVRESYGNDEWSSTIVKVTKLKVSLRSLPTEVSRLTSSLSPSQIDWAAQWLNLHLLGASRTRTSLRLSLVRPDRNRSSIM